jgi:hypothetical protein
MAAFSAAAAIRFPLSFIRVILEEVQNQCSMGFKNIVFLILALVAFQLSSAQVKGTSFSDASRTKQANVVCLFSETPGYIVSSDNGKPKGMLPQMMEHFASYVKKNHGIDVTYSFQPFKKNTNMTEIFKIVNDSGDGVFGLVFVFITDERKRTLNFSDPIFQSPSFLLTSNAVPEVSSQKDISERLKGFTAYANQGNFYEDKFKELKAKSLPDLKIEYFKTYGVTNIAETVAKKNAMMYVDISGFLHAIDNKLPFRNHKMLQFTTPMGIQLSKENSWKEVFNKFLGSGFLKSAEFKKIVSDNLGFPTLNLLKI